MQAEGQDTAQGNQIFLSPSLWGWQDLSSRPGVIRDPTVSTPPRCPAAAQGGAWALAQSLITPGGAHSVPGWRTKLGISK